MISFAFAYHIYELLSMRQSSVENSKIAIAIFEKNLKKKQISLTSTNH